MSLGLEPENRNSDIAKAIANASKASTVPVIFAAAANSGGNKPRAFPANRPGVICIHASDGRGNDGGISPSPEGKKSNFSTLGISIESRWKGKTVLKSGTSFSTPIAAALVADMLEFARYRCGLDEFETECLYSQGGVEKILHLLAHERQGYDYVKPPTLESYGSEADIVGKLTDIARR